MWTAEHAESELVRLEREFQELSRLSFGMPLNQRKPDLSPLGLSGLARYTINNLGDPFNEGSYLVHAKRHEREVLRWFAELYRLEDRQHWGYLTSCGSEGNLFGVYVGREALRPSAASGPDPAGPLVLASKAAHYSIAKAARLLAVEFRSIDALATGAMDMAALDRQVADSAHRSVLLCLCIGTTLKGAIDDVDRALEILARRRVERFYIHCDAALLGAMLPFMDVPLAVHFGKAIDSLSISGHKFLGSPLPCGVVLTRRHHIDCLSQELQVTGSTDITITGSRHGLAALLLWYLIQGKRSSLRAEVEACRDNAEYLAAELLRLDWPFVFNRPSTTLALRRPAEAALCRKYQLSIQGDVARVVVLPHISRRDLELFVTDLRSTRPVG